MEIVSKKTDRNDTKGGGVLRIHRKLFALIVGLTMLMPGILPGSEVGALGSSANWPQWRGPSRDGQVHGSRWPDRLALEPQWRVPLAPSYSGPIVDGQVVFTTQTENEKLEVVVALDRQTGAQRWRTTWSGAMSVPRFAAANGSWIRSTPACDGESLYVAGIRDVLVCLDARTGAERWRFDFMEKLQTPLPAFGFVSSPLVWGDSVIVQAGASVIRLDKKSGRIVWRALKDDGGTFGSAFSSPIPGLLAGQRQLVVQTRQKLAGVDIDNGQVLWSQSVPAYRGMNILTPVIVDDAIFTSSYRKRSWLYEISRNDDEFHVRTAWSSSTPGYMSTPVVIGRHVYMHLQSRRFTCIDLDTGKRTWTSKPFGKYCSLVAQGDRILALVSDGTLLYIHAKEKAFDLIDHFSVSDGETWAHLAVVDNQLFIRDLNGLAAYRFIRPPE